MDAAMMDTDERPAPALLRPAGPEQASTDAKQDPMAAWSSALPPAPPKGSAQQYFLRWAAGLEWSIHYPATPAGTTQPDRSTIRRMAMDAAAGTLPATAAQHRQEILAAVDEADQAARAEALAAIRRNVERTAPPVRSSGEAPVLIGKPPSAQTPAPPAEKPRLSRLIIDLGSSVRSAAFRQAYRDLLKSDLEGAADMPPMPPDPEGCRFPDAEPVAWREFRATLASRLLAVWPNASGNENEKRTAVSSVIAVMEAASRQMERFPAATPGNDGHEQLADKYGLSRLEAYFERFSEHGRHVGACLAAIVRVVPLDPPARDAVSRTNAIGCLNPRYTIDVQAVVERVEFLNVECSIPVAETAQNVVWELYDMLALRHGGRALYTIPVGEIDAVLAQCDWPMSEPERPDLADQADAQDSSAPVF